ncbi:ergothioneine biosynthesis protein EgtB [Ramlibacter sp. USB13]|uniref:Ergothioneine biosynthesis protein EgtB n=2 Tax=Ramlibacter cellulosilyticus TaxID=2764187 RepID=A0A923MTM5_9BURK|nr:ergothioneine biosynthesis protein EgtB [Ramlibacter cellulosilyticus]
MRHASREQLSLALMDARNHTLQLLARFERALGESLRVPAADDVVPPLWLAGHVAWLAEYWIARNPQRALGPRSPADGVRLASIEPQADEWFDPRLVGHAERWSLRLPGLDAIKAYLLDTVETTLELLEHTPDEDDALYFFRMALFHEDLRGEELVTIAQTLGVPVGLALPAGAASRSPLLLPATRWTLGWSDDRSFALDIERGHEAVDVPEFEIDAQPVTWAQYVEFIADGGYDREELWHPRGWNWLERQAAAEGRRGPRHVEQIGVASGAVMQNIFGKPTRMGASQVAMHASWWEAEAWARWAGRRLPTEAEWEIAAQQAARRGFRWGDVREWTAGTLRPFAGFRQDAWAPQAELDVETMFGAARVLRGASFATRARMRHAKARAWALAERDEGFVGFRTCAI